MFSIDFLHILRKYELDYVEKFFFKGAKILEIGGGTGIQAKELSLRGYILTSVDLQSSNYSSEIVFPIVFYDGLNLPFADSSFDIIYSSNVLEHILELEILYKELDRVLKPQGYSIHLMPSGSWRFWSNITNYVEYAQHCANLTPKLFPKNISLDEFKKIVSTFIQILRHSVNYAIPTRHGEKGNCIFEIWTFSRLSWLKHFKKNDFDVEIAQPMKLFYTGYMIFGKKLSMSKRQFISNFFGSSCVLYKIKRTNKK